MYSDNYMCSHCFINSKFRRETFNTNLLNTVHVNIIPILKDECFKLFFALNVMSTKSLNVLLSLLIMHQR